MRTSAAGEPSGTHWIYVLGFFLPSLSNTAVDFRDGAHGLVLGERDGLDGVGHVQEAKCLTRGEKEVVLFAIDLAEVGAVNEWRLVVSLSL